ncbi:FKBP-type peptidyl-prolyl cis-trans isomerase [Sphingomonas sp. CLY1604]|uniref:FKBP-type peptidyl-prolyl cis-trans isomerase n=1 Tax=Sphingomonas sp. CLY1604 TaxID=3457786 RepID=UPI003FD6EBF2
MPDPERPDHRARFGDVVRGSEFDSSYGRGEPIVFPPGKVIPGRREAPPHPGVGDGLEVANPCQLGCGIESKEPIPGGATLLFSIELLAAGTPQLAQGTRS